MSPAATPPSRVRIAAHAKINLFLRVLAREQSGYHAIETLFVLVDLADELSVERAPAGIELTVTGADTGPVEQNLAYRAAQAVLDATGRRFGVRLTLTKRIPVQAGLGGGSADGAAALHAVNHLAGNAVPRHELLQLAAKLGSDVPFAASGAPLALGWGRGERLFRLPPPPSAPVLIALPPFGVSTKAAYDLLDQGRQEGVGRGALVLDDEAFRTWGGIGRLGGNDFEVPVFSKEPGLRDLYEKLAGTRPLLARMSGSGSAVVAIYRNETERDAAASVVGEGRQRLLRTSTRAVPAPGPEAV
jgi:4-diphosphocytidyl-2-C-methyl-D-erythritol kinase